MEEKSERLQKFKDWADSEFTIKKQHSDEYDIDLYNTTIADKWSTINDIVSTLKLSYEYIVGDVSLNNVYMHDEVRKVLVKMKIQRENAIKELRHILFHGIKVKGFMKKLTMAYDITCNMNKLKLECKLIQEQIDKLKDKLLNGYL